MDPETVQELQAYNTWANGRILDAVARLDSGQFIRALGGSFPSVQSTLTHMVWAEWLWLERWQDHSPKELFAPEEFPSVADLKARWGPIQAGQKAFVAALTPGRLRRAGRYTNRKGETWEYALWRQIHHLFNHSTYHRGQVTNMLRLLGAQPTPSDFLDHWDEGR
jgi:uncharacterized damage-inducible protein DinB